MHLAAGQEAAAAGVCQHLRDDDTVTALHRPHHVAIAKGVDLERMTAEIFGREPGLSGGKGGYIHLFDPEIAREADDEFQRGATLGWIATGQELPEV